MQKSLSQITRVLLRYMIINYLQSMWKMFIVSENRGFFKMQDKLPVEKFIISENQLLFMIQCNYQQSMWRSLLSKRYGFYLRHRVIKKGSFLHSRQLGTQCQGPYSYRPIRTRWVMWSTSCQPSSLSLGRCFFPGTHFTLCLPGIASQLFFSLHPDEVLNPRHGNDAPGGLRLCQLTWLPVLPQTRKHAEQTPTATKIHVQNLSPQDINLHCS